MTLFSDKLNQLDATVDLGVAADIGALTVALVEDQSKLVVAVGSGGSAVSAEFLAVCRRSLRPAPTLVQTPTQFVLDPLDLTGAPVWLFSARGENADITAAFSAAIARGAGSINVVTCNADGALARTASSSGRAHLHVLPVADPNDGFLATHSLIAAATGLARAADLASGCPAGSVLDTYLVAQARERLSSARRASLTTEADFRRNDTLLVLADPGVTPVSVLLETSLWETAVCPVQRTDFRNFAHGRHVWLARRAEQTFVLGLTGTDTRESWSEISTRIPPAIRQYGLDYDDCGRVQNLLALLDGLVLIERFAMASDIDPGKPGVEEFGRNIYEGRLLERLSACLTPAVRQKRAATAVVEQPGSKRPDLPAMEAELRERFGATRFVGLVLDYDGTMVAIDARRQPPRPDIVSELNRLLDQGLKLGIATGRGGSAGEALRDHILPQYHSNVVVGYYNGAHIRMLDVDIRDDPPARHEAVDEAIAWLKRNPDLFSEVRFKDSSVQVSIDFTDLHDPGAFSRLFEAFRVEKDLPLRLTRSQHSFDICLARACKTAVVAVIAQSGHGEILCIGDSGAVAGNDHIFLGLPYGVSVDQVCHRPESCWSFFGSVLRGPDALVQILKALVPAVGGGMRLDLGALSTPWAAQAGTRRNE